LRILQKFAITYALRFTKPTLKTLTHICTFALALLCAATAVAGDVPSSEEPPGTAEAVAAAPATAQEALGAMVGRLPLEPITLTGSLIRRKRGGIVEREQPFQFTLEWGENPPRATYRLLNAFGTPMTSLRISRSPDGTVQSTLLGADGQSLTNAPPPLSASIAGTDITWLDATLSFLWWPDVTLAGTDEFRGDLCDLVLAKPPSPMEGCSAMRLWIDRKRGFLRQAEQLDEKGKVVRSMWVSSVGKINDRWMIRNMEIQRPGTGLRTKLHVDDLEAE